MKIAQSNTLRKELQRLIILVLISSQAMGDNLPRRLSWSQKLLSFLWSAIKKSTCYGSWEVHTEMQCLAFSAYRME